jgi:hypothetical protein
VHVLSSSDGSLERPHHCKPITIEESQLGGTGCGLLLYICFALMFVGMGFMSLYNHHQFERRSEVVEAMPVPPAIDEEQKASGIPDHWRPQVPRLVEFTSADGQRRQMILPGSEPLPTQGVLLLRWSGRGKGQLLEEEDFQRERYGSWGAMGLGALMVFHVLRLMRSWSRDAERRQRLRALAQRLPAKRWEVRHFRSGEFNRHRLVVVFQTPDGRHFQAESERFNVDPEPRMHGHAPQVLFDPERPEYSVVAMDSLPSVLGN